MCHDFIRLSSFWRCAPKSLFTDLKSQNHETIGLYHISSNNRRPI